jgi:imidazolonepropionase
MLRVARRIGETLGIGVRTTFLAAHALPPEFEGRADAYIDAVVDWLPRLHAEGLVDAVDAYCEGIGFSRNRRAACSRPRARWAAGQAARRPAQRPGRAPGWWPSSAACRPTTSNTAARTACARWPRRHGRGAAAGRLPRAARDTAAAARCLPHAHGVPMAVATDCNPGTSPLLSLRQAMQLACTHFRLTPCEALRGATCTPRARSAWTTAASCGGMRADFVHWNIREPAELGYWLGGNLARSVHAGGSRVA